LKNNNYELNWNNFKAKYDGREQKSFELLSYVLFCKEMGQRYGIFRYRNQTGVETNTVTSNGEEVGFQAKFYETNVSQNKKDIIDSIIKAKNKNPQIRKIYLYLNKELSESSTDNKIKPKYQEEIEQTAKDNTIQVIWRVPSHFERQLIEPENQWLYEHYFSLNKDIIDFINEIAIHTNNNLASIKTEIKFNDLIIKIQRKNIIEQIHKDLASPIPTIIVGKGGCGKTAIIKDCLTDLNCPLFLFKAYEFNNKTNVNDVFLPFGQYHFSDFLEAFKNESLKVVVIDSAEKLADIENTDTFQYFINNLIQNNWKIIFTTREAYLDDLRSLINELSNKIPSSITVPILSTSELNKLSQKFNFELPEDEKLCEILTIPFYLSDYLNIINNKNLLYKDFQSLLWQKQIMKDEYRRNNLHLRREQAFLELIKQKSTTNSFYVNIHSADNEALEALCNDEIIKYDNKQYGYFITHDIYEEWGLEKFIDKSYKLNDSNVEAFLNTIGNSLPIRRSFRNWLSDKLYDNTSNIQTLISAILPNNKIENFWKDEIVVSIMLSSYAHKFFEEYKSLLLQNNQELLLRVIFMLRIACKTIDYNLLKMLAINKKEWIDLEYVLTMPKGDGWEYAIKFVYENIEFTNKQHVNVIVPFLQDWVLKNKNGKATKYSGKIALYYLNNLKLYNKDLDSVIKIILQSAYEISSELENITDELISGTKIHEYTQLAKTILEYPLESANTIIKFPDKIFNLIKKEWFLSKEPKDNYFGIPVTKEVEENFGLKKYSFDYFPSSAFQTPILLLLKNYFLKTLDFIISIINETTELYANSELAKKYDNVEKVAVTINSENTIEQYCSERLWDMYRGHSVTPYSLQSMLMALERVLLEIAEEKDKKFIEPILFKLLQNTNSAAITAVIASVVTAQPDKLYNIAKFLFQSWEFIHQDLRRKIKEKSTFNLGGFGTDKIYKDEREKSNKLPHREKSLEDVALYYQLCNIEKCSVDINTRRTDLAAIWDILYSNLPDTKKQTEKDFSIRYSLARIDYRKLEIDKIIEDKQSKQTLLTFKTKEEPDLDKKRNEHQHKHQEKMKHIALTVWAENKYKNEATDNNKIYDDNPHLAFEEMNEILKENNPSEDFRLFYHAVPAYVSAVLLEKYTQALTKSELEICKNILLDYARMPINLNYNFQYSDGVQPAIEMLNHIIEIHPKDTQTVEILLIFALFSWKEIRKYAIKCLAKLWNTNFDIANLVWLTYLKFKPEYDKFCQNASKLKYNNKLKEIDKEYKRLFIKIKNILKKEISYKDIDLSLLDYEGLVVGFQILPNGSSYIEHKEFCSEIIQKFTIIFDKDFDYNETNYREVISQFSNKLAYYLLKLPIDKIDKFIEPILLKKHLKKDFSEFLLDLSVIQDEEKEYEKFWYIWILLYEKIKNIVNTSRYAPKEIIENYLLAGYIMNYGNTKSWHSLKKENIEFYYNIANDIGKSSETLYSIARVFNGIASNYIEDGIKILHLLVTQNIYSEIESNTIYYIENIVRNYYTLNKQQIKTDTKLKNIIIDILTFLVNNGSVFGYMLREQIL